MIKNEILELIICPETSEPLIYEGNILKSSKVSYPTLNNVPCLYDDLEVTLGEWSLKIKSYLAEEDSQLKHLQNLANLEANNQTKKRLSLLIEGRNKNKKAFEKFLKLFLRGEEKETVFSSQQIHSYFPNIFRDWCWGQNEIEKSLESFQNEDFAGKKVLILGSGAGGFSYHLAKLNPETEFVSIEHNPFLALISAHIMEGKDLKLFEHTNFPNKLENTAVKRHISKVESLANHTLLMASFPNLPFKDEAFDYIIAPWFFDILDIPYENAIFCAKDFLKKDGTMMAFGPSNIHSKKILDQYSREEIQCVYEKHFKHVELQSDCYGYLQSPIESQTRTEDITIFKVRGKTEASVISLDVDDKLKHDAAFERYKTEISIKAKILDFIKKDMTAPELAEILEREFGLTPEESPRYALKFIQQIKFDY